MSPNRNDPPARRSHRRIGAAGELNGLLRARSFIVDDAHPFCAPGQVAAELRSCLELARELHNLFGQADEPYARAFAEQLRQAAVRGAVAPSGSLAARIRDAAAARVPVVAVVGARERAGVSVALRRAGARDHDVVSLAHAVEGLREEVLSRGR